MAIKFFIKKIVKAFLPCGLLQLTKPNHFYVEIHLADHCNLNCVSCGHFCPVADEWFYDVDEYKKDIERLSELASKHIHTIRLMGGEPLLHKNIVELVEFTRTKFNKTAIYIVTNGILLDRMDSKFWKICKSNNITIQISSYPIELNIKKIFETASQYDVCIKTTPKTTFMSGILDINGLQNKKNSFKKCTSNYCNFLYKGKLYMCCEPALIKYINKYFATNFKVSTEDYVDIYEVKNITELLKFLKNRQGIPFCRYCNINNIQNIPWRTSKKEITEWIYNIKIGAI